MKKPWLLSPISLTAFHEAGHAVMAHLCGQIVTSIDVLGDDEHSGSVSCLRFREEPKWGLDENIPSAVYEARILCLVAGIAAETVVTGKTSWQEGDDDIHQAVRLALRIVGSCDRVVPLLEQAHDHSVELLKRHWSAVDAVAAELTRRRRLSGERVRDLLVNTLDTPGQQEHADHGSTHPTQGHRQSA